MADERRSEGMLPRGPVLWQGPVQACEVNEVSVNVKCGKGHWEILQDKYKFLNLGVND